MSSLNFNKHSYDFALINYRRHCRWEIPPLVDHLYSLLFLEDEVLLHIPFRSLGLQLQAVKTNSRSMMWNSLLYRAVWVSTTHFSDKLSNLFQLLPWIAGFWGTFDNFNLSQRTVNEIIQSQKQTTNHSIPEWVPWKVFNFSDKNTSLTVVTWLHSCPTLLMAVFEPPVCGSYHMLMTTDNSNLLGFWRHT